MKRPTVTPTENPTRRQYLDGDVTFREYYGQFVYSDLPGKIAEELGHEKLHWAYHDAEHQSTFADGTPHPTLNGIPLKDWDLMAWRVRSHIGRIKGGVSQSDCTCVLKQAARTYVETTKENDDE